MLERDSPHLRPIQTSYCGYNFRSRLEARWAVYFDAIGLLWRYEDQGFDLDGRNYLPDFYMPQVGMFAEVKPDRHSFDLDTLSALAKQSGMGVLLLDGVPTCKPYNYLQYIEHEGAGEVLLFDCAVSMFHHYPATEGRFYSCVEECDEDEFGDHFEDTVEAVRRARSARFEWGESGATSSARGRRW